MSTPSRAGLAEQEHRERIGAKRSTERELYASLGQDLTHFLATVKPDGRPDVAGVGALWVDGKFFLDRRAPRRHALAL